MFETELVVDKKYQICTGTLAYMMTFRGVAQKGTLGDRILVFENEDAGESQYRFIGAMIELFYPYRTEKGMKVQGQLYARYYGNSIGELVRNGIPEKPWALV